MRNFQHLKRINDICEHYNLRKSLAKGAFGHVWEATHVKSNLSCAVKKIPKAKLDEASIHWTLMDQEIDILDNYDHPNIVGVFDFCEDDTHIYIALELML